MNIKDGNLLIHKKCRIGKNERGNALAFPQSDRLSFGRRSTELAAKPCKFQRIICHIKDLDQTIILINDDRIRNLCDNPISICLR